MNQNPHFNKAQAITWEVLLCYMNRTSCEVGARWTPVEDEWMNNIKSWDGFIDFRDDYLIVERGKYKL